MILVDSSVLLVFLCDEQAGPVSERFDQDRREEPSALNFGDCLSYGLAKPRNAPLLFVGDDFARTDIVPALHP